MFKKLLISAIVLLVVLLWEWMSCINFHGHPLFKNNFINWHYTKWFVGNEIEDLAKKLNIPDNSILMVNSVDEKRESYYLSNSKWYKVKPYDNEVTIEGMSYNETRCLIIKDKLFMSYTPRHRATGRGGLDSKSILSLLNKFRYLRLFPDYKKRNILKEFEIIGSDGQ